MTSFPGASSSSGHVNLPRKPDVFLSFRGIDTRKGFAYHLYKALDREKIKTFFDDRALMAGENISAALLQAIEASKVSVVICSENYGSSKWCLDELVKILECHESKQQIVFPVFYKVEPAHVRYQIGSFGQAFDGLNSKYGEGKIAGWRAALTQLANLSGLTYVDGYESDFIEEIVKKILDVAGLDDQKKKEDVADLSNQRRRKFQDNREKIRRWGAALTEAASFAGWPIKEEDGNEMQLIEEIVQDISQALPPPPPPTIPQLVKTDHPLGRLESIFPPGGRDKIILYTTTLGALWKTCQACNDVRAVLINLGVKFLERDVSWEHEGYLKELRELMKDKGREATVPPRLFVKGKYVGGYEEVFKLVEEGRFRQIVVDFI